MSISKAPTDRPQLPPRQPCRRSSRNPPRGRSKQQKRPTTQQDRAYWLQQVELSPNPVLKALKEAPSAAKCPSKRCPARSRHAPSERTSKPLAACSPAWRPGSNSNPPPEKPKKKPPCAIAIETTPSPESPRPSTPPPPTTCTSENPPRPSSTRPSSRSPCSGHPNNSSKKLDATTSNASPKHSSPSAKSSRPSTTGSSSPP